MSQLLLTLSPGRSITVDNYEQCSRLFREHIAENGLDLTDMPAGAGQIRQAMGCKPVAVVSYDGSVYRMDGSEVSL